MRQARRCVSKWNGLLRGRPRSGSYLVNYHELPGESLWKELEDGGELRGSGRVRNMKKVVRRNCCCVCVSAGRGRLVITTAWRLGVENSRVKRPVSPGETEKEQRCTDGPISWCFLWTDNGNGKEAVLLQKMHERKINSTKTQQILGKNCMKLPHTGKSAVRNI